MHKGVLALFCVLLVVPAVGATITVPTFGARTTSSTTDFRPSLFNIDSDAGADPAAYVGRVDRNSNDDVTDDCFYLRFGAATTGVNLVSGDFILAAGSTASGCSTPGTFLTSSSAEVQVATPLVDLDEAGALTDVTTVIKFLEVDGKSGFSPGDMLYVDITNSVTTGCALAGAANTLGVCDIRLRAMTIGSALAFGSLVVSGSGDLSAAGTVDGTLPDTTTLTDLTGESFHFFDTNQNRVLDSGDSLYLRSSLNGPGTQVHNAGFGAFVPIQGDTRLSAYGSNAAGSVVGSGSTDHVPTLETVPTLTVLAVGAHTGSDRLYLHFGAGTTQIQFGDVALNTVSGQTAGVMATTAATGVGLGGLTSAFAAGVFTIDTNGNGKIDDTDGIYWDLPAAFGGTGTVGKLSTNDIRLRPPSTGGFAAGSTVGASDADRTTFVEQGTAGGFTPKFFDADLVQGMQFLRALTNAKVSGADNALGAADAAYVESTAAVATGSVRVTGFSYAGGSVVAAGNPDINTVGGALTALSNLRVKDTTANSNYDAGECAYISTDLFVSVGDTRVTTCLTFAAGSTVAAADGDCLPAPSCTGTTSAIVDTTFLDYVTGADATFTAGTDAVYIDTDGVASTSVAAGFTRVTPVAFAGATTVSCTAPANVDCGASLLALTNAKVTGSDGAWSAVIGASATEWVYVSSNDVVDATDLRITSVTLNTFTGATGSTVASGDADLPGSDFGSGDGLYLSPVALTGAAGASKIPQHGELRLVHPTLAFGSSVSTGNADFTPRYLALVDISTSPPGNLFRYDRGNTGTITDDTFFLRPGTSTTATPQSGDIRLLPSLGTLAAGTMFSSGDLDGSAPLVVDPNAGQALGQICFVNPTGSTFSGYDGNDFVYIDNAPTGFSGLGTLTQNDIRLTAITGAGTFAAGTMVGASDGDRVAFTTCTGHASNGLGTTLGNRAWMLKILDQDYDGVFDAGGTDNQKLEHVLLSADANDGTATPCDALSATGPQPGCSTILLLGDIPLTGAATSAGSSGGGGSTTVVTTTSTSSTSTTTSSTSTTSSSTTSTAPAFDVEAANQAVQDSLEVKRKDGQNELTWEPQSGATGYQVWSADSPFVLLGEVAGDQGSYTDTEGGKDTKYLVTAFFSDLGKLTADLVNNGEVPGLSGVPTGEEPTAQKRGFIPAPGLAVALLGVGLALMLVRRKL